MYPTYQSVRNFFNGLSNHDYYRSTKVLTAEQSIFETEMRQSMIPSDHFENSQQYEF